MYANICVQGTCANKYGQMSPQCTRVEIYPTSLIGAKAVAVDVCMHTRNADNSLYAYVVYMLHVVYDNLKTPYLPFVSTVAWSDDHYTAHTTVWYVPRLKLNYDVTVAVHRDQWVRAGERLVAHWHVHGVAVTARRTTMTMRMASTGRESNEGYQAWQCGHEHDPAYYQ